jgi:hypothetical protein
VEQLNPGDGDQKTAKQQGSDGPLPYETTPQKNCGRSRHRAAALAVQIRRQERPAEKESQQKQHERRNHQGC